MFDIKVEEGEVQLIGRLDATQVEAARVALGAVNASCTVDFQSLEYISSAGLGLLLSAQKRLTQQGQSLKLKNLNSHISEIFRIAGFDKVFQIE